MNNKTRSTVSGSVVLALGFLALVSGGCAQLKQLSDFSLTYHDDQARDNQIVVRENHNVYVRGYAQTGGYGRYTPDVFRDGGAMNRAVPHNQRLFGR